MEVTITFSSLLIQNKLLTICETLGLCYCFPKHAGARVWSSQLAGRQESVRFGPRNPPSGQIILSQTFLSSSLQSLLFIIENDLLAQEVELELRQGLEDQLDQLSIYFQVIKYLHFPEYVTEKENKIIKSFLCRRQRASPQALSPLDFLSINLSS